MNEKLGKPFWRSLVPAMTAISLLTVLYLCAYYVAVKGENEEHVGHVDQIVVAPSGRVASRFHDEYRIGGRASKVFFWPANQLDRIIRRDRWFYEYNYTPPPGWVPPASQGE